MGGPVKRRTQGERTAQTRAALITAARGLFGSEGFAEVSAERIAREAGMTRGALYHQFADKADLFAAVLDEVEAEIAQRVVGAVAGFDPADTTGMLLAGASAWLDASSEPDLQRIVLLDGPSVLGWDRWREICLRHTVGLIAALLQDGIDRGSLPPQPVQALTHVLVGAVDEAALYIARADDGATARADMDLVLRRLTQALSASA
ncbi:MAG TPA: TetR/AcrR family transcriptional regulator [Streptosporangiaceae bacterium]|nr:TetR/AcrR family transcriptional regulator [Streptosporangiaceae bacterium]